MKLKLISGALAFTGMAVAGLAATNTAQAQATLAQIKQRGAMNCGVDTGLAGFAFKDDKGACRAIAAAVLKDPEKVNYVPLTTKLRFTALKAGDVDVLIRDSTLTFTRGTQLGLSLAGVNFYAGQGFMVKASLDTKKVTDLDGATICTLAGATLELNIADYNRARNVKITPLLFDKADEAFSALEA